MTRRLQITSIVTSIPAILDVDFDSLNAALMKHFKARVSTENPIFRVETTPDLEAVYLQTLGPIRQQHNCRCCLSFLREFGSMAHVVGGKLVSVLWSIDLKLIPQEYAQAVALMNLAVQNGAIKEQVFVPKNTKSLGVKHQGGWGTST